MIGACDIETGSLVLSVDTDDLKSFVHALRHDANADFALTPPAPRPIFRPITRLAIRPKADGPLSVKIEGDGAMVTGGRRSLRLLADELVEFHEENDLYEPGMHAHFDPTEKQCNGLKMSQDSLELIVTGPVADDLIG